MKDMKDMKDIKNQNYNVGKYSPKRREDKKYKGSLVVWNPKTNQYDYY